MDKLKQLLKIISPENKIFIQSHNYPDPDSIGSAVGLQFVLKNFGIKSKIIYFGRIFNKTVIDILEKYKVKLYNINDIQLKKSDKVIIVDTQLNNSNIKKLPADYIGEIDHHNIEKLSELPYSDLHPNIGACSTIIAQYLLKLKNVKIPAKIATMLLIGIFIDTNRLSRKVTKQDVKMVFNLFDYADIFFLNYITINSINIKDLKLFKYGIKSFERVNDSAIINIKKIDSPHLLAIVCDFFIQLKEINLVIGYAKVGKKILISVRSEVKRYQADKIARLISADRGNAGGHSNMAAGIIDNIKFKGGFSKYLKDLLAKI